MKYLLIIFVMALAVAPLTHFLPSKRQRQVVRLREYAAVHGLFVEFRDLPGSREVGQRTGRRAEQVIYYGLRLVPSRNKPRGQRTWLRNADGWRGFEHREVLNPRMQGVPEAVSAIGFGEASCGIYWLEAGTEEDVEAIRVALNNWAQELKLAS